MVLRAYLLPQPWDLERKANWEGCGHLKPQSSPQWHTSPNKVTPPNPSQTIPPNEEQAFKYRSQRGPFSFRSLQLSQVNRPWVKSSEDWTCKLTWEHRERARKVVSPAFSLEMVPFNFNTLKNNVKPRFCQLTPLLFMFWHFHSICTYYSVFSVWLFLFVVNC